MWFRGHIKFVKTAAVVLAATVYVPLVADWVEPGASLHQAAVALGAAPGQVQLPVWGFLVRQVGRDVLGLGTLSMLSALVCVGIVVTIANDLMIAAIRSALRRGQGDFVHVRSAAVLLAAGAFVFTPGFFRAATRIGPLMPMLVPALLALAAMTRILLGAAPNFAVMLRQNGWRTFWFMLFAVYSVWIGLNMRQTVLEAGATLRCFALVGVVPLLLLAVLARRNKSRLWLLAVWAVAVVACAVMSLSGREHGRTASRFVERVVANAGRAKVVVGGGGLDDVFYFMLPERMRYVSLAREHDSDYVRAVADWIDAQGYVKREAEDGGSPPPLGLTALLEDWQDRNAESFRSVVCRPADYFPTVEKWQECCALLARMPSDEAGGNVVRRILGACGNQLGRGLLARKDRVSAWTVFWGVLDRVDGYDEDAIICLLGMAERGYAASKQEKERLQTLRGVVRARLRARDEQMKREAGDRPNMDAGEGR